MSKQITRYLSAEKMTADDFGHPFTMQVGEFVWDAKTLEGPWATMSLESFRRHGHQSARQKLGVGRGQMYVRDNQGHLILIDGDQE